MEKEKKYKRKIIGFVLLVAFVIFLLTLLLFVSPKEIVDEIGVKNGYILIFIVSFFGGFSAGGSVSYISLLITLAAGGMNPLLLGLVSGVSLAIGDMIMFYTGKKGRDLVSGKWDKRIDKFSEKFVKKKKLKKFIPYFAYLYMGFLPLPNDVLLLFLAAIEYPVKKMRIIITLGDITFALFIAIVSTKSILL